FRSAAAQRDGRVIGVILSGNRDDGTAGLAAIKARGGMAIVQDPRDALYAGMPSSALAHVAADAVVPCDQVAAAIAEMVNGGGPSPSAPINLDVPIDTVESAMACPDCGGVLFEDREAGIP